MCQDVQRTIPFFSLSQADKFVSGSGASCAECILGLSSAKDFPSTGRIVHNQPAAARLHCMLLTQGATTETRKVMVQKTIDLSLVSRGRNCYYFF